MSVTLRLDDEIDISRGDMIVDADEPPTVARELEAMICWMSEQPLRPGGALRDQAHDALGRARSSSKLEYRVDVNTLDRDPAPTELGLNEIGRVHLRSTRAAGRRPLRAQPHDRQLHPDRRVDQRHRRRRDDHQRHVLGSRRRSGLEPGCDSADRQQHERRP